MQTLASSKPVDQVEPSLSAEETTLPPDQLIYKNKLAQAESYIAVLESKNKDLFSAVCDAFEVSACYLRL